MDRIRKTEAKNKHSNDNCEGLLKETLPKERIFLKRL